MSREAVGAFMSKVEEDAALREELRSLASDEGVSIAAMAEFARSKGYDFSVEDVSASSELSDEELESVSGGGSFDPVQSSFLKFSQKVYPGFGGSLFFKW
jgi:predicted ribosomally synthesized peptide with nif11-like leader